MLACALFICLLAFLKGPKLAPLLVWGTAQLILQVTFNPSEYRWIFHTCLSLREELESRGIFVLSKVLKSSYHPSCLPSKHNSEANVGNYGRVIYLVMGFTYF